VSKFNKIQFIKYIVIIIASSTITFGIICNAFFNLNKYPIIHQISLQDKSGDFKFLAIPSKGRDYKMMENSLEKYKIENGIQEEVQIYRTTAKNYFKINMWDSYKFRREWQYPYLVN